MGLGASELGGEEGTRLGGSAAGCGDGGSGRVGCGDGRRELSWGSSCGLGCGLSWDLLGVVENGRVGGWRTIWGPPLGLVLGTDVRLHFPTTGSSTGRRRKAVDGPIGRDVAWFEMSFPPEVGSAVTPFPDGLESRVNTTTKRSRERKTDVHLFGGPQVEIDGLDTADVGAHATVYARATNAEKHTAGRGQRSRPSFEGTHAQIPGRPSGVYQPKVRNHCPQEKGWLGAHRCACSRHRPCCRAPSRDPGGCVRGGRSWLCLVWTWS